MFDLAEVLQLVENGLDQRAAAKDGLFEVGAVHGLHVLLEGGDDLEVLLGQGVGEPLGDVALVGEQQARQPFAEVGHGLAVVDVAGGQLEPEQLALGIDDGVQLEAVEPAH